VAVKLRNKTKDTLEVRYELGSVVKPNEVIDVKGTAKEQGDAIVVTDGDYVRAWPAETWSLVSSAKDKPAVKDEE
jgi:hypothetical protein